MEHALFTAADELDLPARRMRGALKRLFASMRKADITLDAGQQILESWIANAS